MTIGPGEGGTEGGGEGEGGVGGCGGGGWDEGPGCEDEGAAGAGEDQKKDVLSEGGAAG